jgi:hypothetical protein
VEHNLLVVLVEIVLILQALANPELQELHI